MFDGLKTVIAPVHLPIIKPPQYIEIYGAICVSFNEPNAEVFNNSPRLLWIETSTPT